MFSNGFLSRNPQKGPPWTCETAFFVRRGLDSGVDDFNNYRIKMVSQPVASPEGHAVLTFRLQTCTTDKESIHVRLLCQLSAVLAVHTTTVDDPRVLGSFGGDGFGKPFSDGRVDFLRLF